MAPESAAPLRSALEALSDGVAVFDEEMCLVTCNQRYIEMFPLIADLIRPGAHWDDMLRACVERRQIHDPFDDVEAFMNRAIANRIQFDREILAHHTDGKVYQVSFAPAQSGGYVVMRRDVTEQLTENNLVRDREALLATVLDASPAAIVMARVSDSRIFYRSEEARAVLGETSYALSNFADPDARAAYLEAMRETGRVDGYRFTCLRKDGTAFEVSASGRMIEFAGDTYVVSALTDLTAQLEREELIRYVVQSCPTPIQMISVETGEVLYSSPETRALFGDVKSARSFYVDPGHRDAFVQELREKGMTREFKSQFFNRNGEKFWASVSANLLWHNGREVMVSHTRDMTSQLAIEAELNEQKDLMFQNEKMSALGELLAGVAHELNNPLSVVVGHALMLKEDTEDERLLRQIQKISDAAERSAKIVKTFLTMARQQPAHFEAVDMNDVVKTAVDVARYGDLGKSVTMDYDLAPALPTCWADADQITQVLLNLILNAEHAIQSSGVGDRITVRTMPDADKGMIRVEVEDNGPGIPMAHRSRVFEPFFTTKDVGQGTGIGLTLSHRIVRSHNGQIILDKSLATGTRFLIEIPCANDAQTGLVEVNQLASDTDKSARILIVDDEVDVADMNAEVLTRAGYTVEVANTARHGIARIRENAYDLVISDLNMPEIDGRGLFETIKAEFPALADRIGFVTGDTMGKASQRFLKEANQPFLEKPASPKELRAFVSGLLSDARART